MLWTVDELTNLENCWHTSQNFNPEVIIAVFATKSLLELGGGDNLNFMNFKIDIFKIRKFYELLKFVKFEFSIYAP